MALRVVGSETEMHGAEGPEAPAVLTLPLGVQQLFPAANPMPSAGCLAAHRTEAQPPWVSLGVPSIHSSRTRSASQTNRLWHPLIAISLLDWFPQLCHSPHNKFLIQGH